MLRIRAMRFACCSLPNQNPPARAVPQPRKRVSHPCSRTHRKRLKGSGNRLEPVRLQYSHDNLNAAPVTIGSLGKRANYRRVHCRARRLLRRQASYPGPSDQGPARRGLARAHGNDAGRDCYYLSDFEPGGGSCGPGLLSQPPVGDRRRYRSGRAPGLSFVKFRASVKTLSGLKVKV
jgi:hypothetical protein